MQTQIELYTNGQGWWSEVSASVCITGLVLDTYDETFGELQVVFDTNSWITEEYGLIYTDPLFIKMLREMLNDMGLLGKDVGYSEQGMQGDNYVSCDVGAKFIESWKTLMNTKETANV
jgi:hypothetical protein